MSEEKISDTPLIVNDSERNVTMALPDETLSDIRVESGTNLNVIDWGTPTEIIDAGSTGQINLPVSTDPRRFFSL